MKRSKLSVLILTTMLCLTMSILAHAEPKGLKYTIMVSKFENKTGGGWQLGDAWSAILTDSLSKTGRFIVLGEKDMRAEAMNEQDFAAMARAAGEGKKVVMGQMTPAQLLVKGDITGYERKTGGNSGGIGFGGFNVGMKTSSTEINAVMYIVDSSTGQVLGSTKCYGVVNDSGMNVSGHKDGYSGDLGTFSKTNEGKAMEQAVNEGIKYLLEKLPSIAWTGSIVSMKGTKVTINRGTREGVDVGNVFTVGEKEETRDPDTGELLDTSIETKGEIKVTSVKEKIAICETIKDTGIAKGMTIIPKK